MSVVKIKELGLLSCSSLLLEGFTPFTEKEELLKEVGKAFDRASSPSLSKRFGAPEWIIYPMGRYAYVFAYATTTSYQILEDVGFKRISEWREATKTSKDCAMFAIPADEFSSKVSKHHVMKPTYVGDIRAYMDRRD